MDRNLQKLSFLLDGGIDTRSSPELIAPVVQQGSSPNLVASVNTRFSPEPGTCVRSPGIETAKTLTAATPIHGVVPSSAGRNAVVFVPRGVGRNQVIADAGRETWGTGPARSVADSDEAQNCYIPVQISASGAIPTLAAQSSVATVYDPTEDRVWYAYYVTSRADPVEIDLFLTAVTPEGVQVIPPTKAFTMGSGTSRWLGLTYHEGYGIRLWYVDNSPALLMRAITVSGGNLVSAGSPISILSPGHYLNHALSVVSGQGQNAYVATTSSADPDDGRVAVVRVDTGAIVTSQTVTGVTTGGSPRSALAYIELGGVPHLGVAFASFDNTECTFGLYSSSLTSLWTPITVGEYGDVAVKFLITPESGSQVCFAYTRDGSLASGTSLFTQLLFASVASGSSSDGPVLPWMRLVNHGVQHTVSATETYPLFFLARHADFIDDQSIEAYLAGSITESSPIARFGCVRGTANPALTTSSRQSSSACVAGGKVVCTYRKSSANNYSDYPARYVVLDLSPHQPAVAHDRDGCALVAAACPVQWDGVEVSPLGGPLHGPALYGADTGGSGAILDAGVYSFMALYQWTDASGLVHRSKPSNAVTLTMSGAAAPLLRVPLPEGLNNGVSQAPPDVLIYATPKNGNTYHLTFNTPSIISDTMLTYGVVTVPAVSDPAIYSIPGLPNQEQTPQAAPPLWDVAVIGSRAWGIDAELRNRLVYTKLRGAGLAFEWHPAYEIIFPAGAGKLMAVREHEGTPIVITEFAVYQIVGNGPTNTVGSGSDFAAVKLDDVGCSNRSSVQGTPAGIVWQTGDSIALFAGGKAQLFPNVRVTNTISNTVLFRNYDEVLFCSSSAASILVWNYKRNRWSVWDSGTLSTAIQNAAVLPHDADTALLYSQSTGLLHRMDARTYSATANMSWETDWILLGGDFQDHIHLTDVVFSAYRGSPHALRIKLFTDYASSASTEKSWTAAQINDDVTPTGRYVRRADPSETSSRGIKLRIEETAEAAVSRIGVKPGAVTLYYKHVDIMDPDAFTGTAHQ